MAMTEREERLFTRATDILDGRANGFGLPILRHLALSGFGPGMLWLAIVLSKDCVPGELGRLSDPSSPLGLMRRAFRLGEPNAAQNLAMTYFHLGDMAGYRRWLHRAASGGDTEAMQELKSFELRKPYPPARRLRRLRPYNRNGY